MSRGQANQRSGLGRRELGGYGPAGAAIGAGEELSWDAENLKISNNPEARRFIGREEYR